MSSETDLLTLDAAAHVLGWTGRFRGRRLRRIIDAAETKLGRAMSVRVGRRKDRKVTIGALRQHCPELFEVGIDHALAALRKTFEAIDSKLDRRIAEHPKIQELESGQRRLVSDLLGLAKRVERMV